MFMVDRQPLHTVGHPKRKSDSKQVGKYGKNQSRSDSTVYFSKTTIYVL